MKNNFIPVDNNLSKTIAFANSLDKDFRIKNRIKQKEHYIETLDVVRDLQKQGWRVNGVCEQRGSNRKIINNYVKLEHPDFSMMNKKSKEGTANLYISNSCTGKTPLNLDLGMHRLVCSNGLVRKVNFVEHSIKHTEINMKRLPSIISNINKAAAQVVKEYESLKHIELAPNTLNELLTKAAELRFERGEIDYRQLLNIHRSEDKGNDLWSVYNRIQENLTKPGLLLNKDGKLMSGTYDVKNDIHVNQALFELVESYA